VELYIEIGVDGILMENAEQAKKSPEMTEQSQCRGGSRLLRAV
jgi:hypothetical protein